MAEKRPLITVILEGDEGYNGNVLADALVRKLEKLLAVLARMERVFGELGRKQTDYQITKAEKFNPTRLELGATPRVKGYDPSPAFFWSYDQMERVATGAPVDPRIDALIASELASLAEHERAHSYRRFCLGQGERSILLDVDFQARATELALERRLTQSATSWYEGTSLGEVVGTLRQVGDIEGDLSIVLVPRVGPAQIQCTFPEEWRKKLPKFLWKDVRVKGKLYYRQSSPFPYSVDVFDMDELNKGGSVHLLDLEGLFVRRERSAFYMGNLLNG